jgi:hypothetical protein
MRRDHAPLILCGLLWGLSTTVSAAESGAAPGDDDFQTSGDIPCSVSAEGPLVRCPFGVQRDGGGTATVTVFLPDEAVRVIRFENGVVKGAEKASGPAPVAAERAHGVTRIRLGDERYEIPDDVISGG